MKHGPQGQKRPDSPTQAAVQVAKIATGQTREAPSNRRTIRLTKGQKIEATDRQ